MNTQKLILVPESNVLLDRRIVAVPTCNIQVLQVIRNNEKHVLVLRDILEASSVVRELIVIGS